MDLIGRETLVTEEGLRKLNEEHDHLVSVRRPEVAAAIKSARELGDLSENAEYDAAKNDQARLETRIIQIEERLRTARIIGDADTSSVNIGTRVTVVEVGSKDEEEFFIVGSTEADPLEGKVSNESPVGKSLMGSAVGDKVDVPVPSGTITYEIRRIDR